MPRGVKVEAPILLTAVQAHRGTALNWRVLVVLEEGAEAEVWEQYARRPRRGLFNTVVELVVGQNAHLRFVSGQDLDEKSWVFGTQRARVDRDGKLDWVALGFGAGGGKVFLKTDARGRGRDGEGHRRLRAARPPAPRLRHDAGARGREHDLSDLAFRGILDGRSSAVWRGMIKVDEGAQQTDAFQESRNLLLSKKAHADAIPGLEILANDVRCTHAAAIAQIDPEQLFYLRSRGLSARASPRAWSSRASSPSSSSASRRARCARPSPARSSAASSRPRLIPRGLTRVS